MSLTPSGSETSSGPDSPQAKLSVAPRSVSADSHGRPGPPAGPSPRQGVNMASSEHKGGDREKALESALVQIERQFGKGSVMRLGDEARSPVEVIPTGSIALDIALGIGGVPRGGVFEIYGPEGSGKALALDTPIPTPKGWTTMGELSA